MKRLLLAVWAVAWAVLLVVGWFAGSAHSREGKQPSEFHFALLGDVPYSTADEERFLDMLKDINADRTLAFVVHDGDFKDGHSLCTDELFRRRLDQFQGMEHPLVFIFGDNEWTDCRREEAGRYDPLERLDKLRELFASGRESLGKRTLPLSRQSDDPRYRKFRENVRWSYGDVLFVGLNIPGSYNNVAQKQEYKERNTANGAWLKESFRSAATSGARGVMVIIHANPNFHSPDTSRKRNPYRPFLSALEREVRAFGKPVVLVHGDTHEFRIDKPLRDSKTGQPIDNLTRVETFGAPDVRWIKGTVDVRDPSLFRFTPMDQENRSPTVGLLTPSQ